VLTEIQAQQTDLVDEKTQTRVGKFLGATHLCLIYPQEIRFVNVQTLQLVSVFTIGSATDTESIHSNNKASFLEGILPNLIFNFDISWQLGETSTVNEFGTSETIDLSNPNLGFGIMAFNSVFLAPMIGVLTEDYHNLAEPSHYSFCYGGKVLIQIKKFGFLVQAIDYDGNWVDGLNWGFGISYWRIYGIVSLLRNNGLEGGLGFIFSL